MWSAPSSSETKDYLRSTPSWFRIWSRWSPTRWAGREGESRQGSLGGLPPRSHLAAGVERALNNWVATRASSDFFAKLSQRAQQVAEPRAEPPRHRVSMVVDRTSASAIPTASPTSASRPNLDRWSFLAPIPCRAHRSASAFVASTTMIPWNSRGRSTTHLALPVLGRGSLCCGSKTV